jgi:hypothetical protein
VDGIEDELSKFELKPIRREGRSGGKLPVQIVPRVVCGRGPAGRVQSVRCDRPALGKPGARLGEQYQRKKMREGKMPNCGSTGHSFAPPAMLRLRRNASRIVLVAGDALEFCRNLADVSEENNYQN